MGWGASPHDDTKKRGGALPLNGHKRELRL
jgi:hypothetical protein